MENTGKVFFENDGAPQWYLAVADKWVGPMTAQDVYEKILKQEISWAHFVWKKGQANWQRICDVPTFQAAVPGQPKGTPSPDPGAKTSKKEAAVAASTWQEANRRIWFLYYNDSQFGPFTEEEIRRFLNLGKIHGRVHAWKEGMNGWNRLEKVGGFETEIAEADRVRQEKKESAKKEKKAEAQRPPARPSSGEDYPQAKYKDQRKAPRRPLLARIVLAHQDEVVVGVCRDVSIGGMQVLTAKIPGLPGSRIKLNVSPAGEAASKKKGLKPFVAEGLIVRLLEDGRGFSFRFEKLPPESREVIEKYIAAELEG
ncbi:MAG: DUF4339 domain-containing protein [Bdellovibrionales bacterium]|nr:DUF4339 domain-containing protein [Bdellovibrionales bacterium]